MAVDAILGWEFRENNSVWLIPTAFLLQIHRYMDRWNPSTNALISSLHAPISDDK